MLCEKEVIAMFETMTQEMKLRNFSPRTMETYVQCNRDFYHWVQKNPRDVSGQDIRHYLLHLVGRQYASSTINLIHAALAFYYGTILRKNISDLPYQKREQYARLVPEKKEIKEMIERTKNTKHKLVIGLLYAAGLRCSEIIKIKLEDIDVNRRLLLVRQGKGAKDRYTILSEKIIEQIKHYLRTRLYQSPYLFASCDGHITTRTVEAILAAASHTANTKKYTPHSLRHSFATHLMEAGTKTEYIQQLLGHKDLRTTRIYEGITTRHLQAIPSPHDSL